MAFKSSNTEEFIIKAMKVHGNKYDYSQVVYVKNSIKVNIICKKHGVFSQTPQCHIKGSGCPICARYIKYTKEVCQNEANKYATRGDFRINSPKIYDVACTKHWLDEICSHMPKPSRWTDELLIELASQCSNMQELKELNFKAYIHVTHTKGKSSFVRGYFKKQLKD